MCVAEKNLGRMIYVIVMLLCVSFCTVDITAQTTITIKEICEETNCEDGIDEDGDGLTDCDDLDCKPIINSINIDDEVCADGLGAIIVEASGTDLLYILNGSIIQTSGVFQDLAAGPFVLIVRNNTTGCEVEYPYPIILENTCEILGNGIDDDGDGDIDCEDSQHYAKIRTIDFVKPTCERNEDGVVVNDGWIRMEADGENLEYRIVGTYELVLGQIMQFDQTSTDGLFENMPPGSYTLMVTNTVSQCSSSRQLALYRSCEVCNNDLDDDGDGDIGCDDIDCLLQQIALNAKGGSVEKRDDICTTLSEEEIDILGSFEESAKVETEKFFPTQLEDLCGDMKSYFIAPDGRLIDPDKVSEVHFLSPSSINYKNLKYVVAGVEINNGDYYQAVTRTIDIGKEFQNKFLGYYRYDRSTKKFDTGILGGHYQLEVDIYIEANIESADAIAVIHSGVNCTLEYYCLEDWTFVSINMDITSVQTEVANRIIALNKAPEVFESCGSTNSGDILIFVNGYRLGEDVADYNDLSFEELILELTEVNDDVEDLGNIWFTDPFRYWNHSGRFKERLKPKTTVFADGHLDINTSNHRNKIKFGVSLFSLGVILNDTDNPDGFLERRTAGMRAGVTFVNMIIDETIPTTETNKKIDQKIDIVAHSMGYAYALGMIEAIKNSGLQIEFDRFYILAPENAASANANVEISDFEEVWQYGSKRERPVHLENEDKVGKQDGVAAQRGVQDLFMYGITSGIPNAYGRAFIPSIEPKGFLVSHSESSYHWIFEFLKHHEDDGFVDPK